MLISKFMQEGSPAARFKAPRHKMYRVHNIMFTTLVGGNNALSIIPYLLEDGINVYNPSLSSDLLAVFDTAIAGNHHSAHLPEPEDTKFITIARTSSTTFNAFVVINYELIKASKPDLIWEWFRKGR